MYKLKSNVADFEVVDGAFAGRKFKAGEVYQEIPPAEAGKFEKISAPQTPTQANEPGNEDTETHKGGKNR